MGRLIFFLNKNKIECFFVSSVNLYFNWFPDIKKRALPWKRFTKSTADAISLSSRSEWSGKVENDSTLRPENRAAIAKTVAAIRRRTDKRFGGELREGTGGDFRAERRNWEAKCELKMFHVFQWAERDAISPRVGGVWTTAHSSFTRYCSPSNPLSHTFCPGTMGGCRMSHNGCWLVV